MRWLLRVIDEWRVLHAASRQWLREDAARYGVELRSEARNWLNETVQDEIYRRLAACETSVQELWKAHNERGGA